MRIAIIGSGGREHAICQKIYQSKKVEQIFCLPGNGGTKKIANNIEIDLKNFDIIKNFLIDKKIDITIIGPEEPLVNGLVDFLKLNKLKVFGPDKFCSQLEGSKIFTKKICQSENIPTANFEIFNDIKSAINFLCTREFPLVVKADGLAAGKGVYICENLTQAKKATYEIFEGKYGKANEILIEEFLNGEEMSFFVISDGTSFKFFNTAQDHKRIFDNDKGPNTGGMGAYSPSRLISEELKSKIIQRIIIPTVNYLKKNKGIYIGFLYAGLMIKNKNPYLIEYNVRMGDPECQTILPLLKNDLAELVKNCVEGNLEKTDLDWKKEKSICIVVSSKGYPGKFEKNIHIKNLDKLDHDENEYIFHAGTNLNKGQYYSSGGRVLNFVSINDDLNLARELSLNLIKKLNWENGHFRKDIGHKIINK